MNDGTGTDPYWIASLTDDYSAYMRAHARTESWWAANIGGQRTLGGTPGHSLVQPRVKLDPTKVVGFRLLLACTPSCPLTRETTAHIHK